MANDPACLIANNPARQMGRVKKANNHAGQIATNPASQITMNHAKVLKNKLTPPPLHWKFAFYSPMPASQIANNPAD